MTGNGLRKEFTAFQTLMILNWVIKFSSSFKKLQFYKTKSAGKIFVPVMRILEHLLLLLIVAR